MKKILFIFILLSSFTLSWTSLHARSWDDLDAGEHDIYGSEREEKFPVKALFMEMEEWQDHYSFMFLWLFKYTDYPRYTSTRLLPLYYGLDSKIDNRSLTVFPPLLTWLERDADEYTKFILFPLYYSNYSNYEYNRSLLWPFIWWGASSPKNGKWENSYNTIVPIWLHMRNDNFSSDYGESMWINPLFFSYSYYSKGETTEYMWWMPIIPVLTFHSVDQYGGHRNFFTLLDYSWRTEKGADTLERFWLMPLLFWGEGKDGYTYILPPAIIYNKYDNGDYYVHLLPLFSVWKDSYGEVSKQVLTPLFGRRKVTDAKTGDELYSNFFFPLIPIFFRSRDRDEGTHTNIAWLLDWESNKDGTMRTFWLAPFIFHEFKDYGYRIYFPFYIRTGSSDKEGSSWGLLHYHGWDNYGEAFWCWPYYSGDDSDGSWYRHFIPLFAAWENKYTGIMTEKQVITPLWGRRKVTDDKTGENIYSNFFFPVIPLFFTSTDRSEGTHTNIAWLLDWERNSDGTMRTFWLAPFVFHEFKDYGYRIYFPFYIRPGGTDEQNGVSFSLFHYHSWSPGDDTLWAWLYYHNETSVVRDPKAGLVPENNGTEEYYRHFLPLYWSWENSDSSATLLLPLYLNYRDRYTKLHINLSGVAYKTFTGPFSPELGLGLQNRDKSWYLDTDISWFYDIVGVSWRIPVIKGETDPSNGDKIKNDTADKPVAIKKKSVSRDDSENFFGWEILFGWMAYRHADTRYHFRLLPLSWFTWDASSEDKFYMFLPFFMSYYSEETKTGYFMLAPFYASQSEGESYSRGYLINLYWDEYDAPSNYREKSILWPFINFYYSPEKHGFRLFPIFWYANWKEEDNRLSRSISPLHYSMSIEDGAGNYTYRKRLNPLYYVKENVNVNYSSYTFFAPIIPLFYYTSSQERGANGLIVDDTTSISPFHIYSGYSTKNNTESYDSYVLMVPIIPLFYKSKENTYNHWNFLGIIDRATDTDFSRFFIFPFFYTSQTGPVKYRNILGIIDWETGGSTGGSSMFLPFYIWHGGEESSLTIPLMLSYFSSGKDWKTRFIAGVYWHNEPGYEHQDVLLMYDHIRTDFRGIRNDEYSFILDTISIDISPEVMEMQVAWGLLAEYTRNSRTGEYDFDALLWFAGFDNERGGFHSRLMPVWYYQSFSKDDWFLVIPPLLSYFSRDGSGDFDLALLGALYYRNENTYSGEDRRMVLLGSIYNEVKKPERKYHARGSLWGLLWDYETEGESNFTKFTILKGLYKYVEKDGKGEHTVFWFL